MNEPVAGKFLLEILTKGMYSNPMHVYREYIQNCSDSIDQAIEEGILQQSEAAIHIQVDSDKRQISIRDNGVGIPASVAQTTLLSIGASEKGGVEERGFRGIGRLAGLAYADEVQFITSCKGDTVQTIMTCDCARLLTLLQKSNNETSDVMETFKAISSFDTQPADVDTHYFEVCMIGVPKESGLLDENSVCDYLAKTAPVDFNDQKFSQAQKIRSEFASKGFPITCYKIFRGSRKLPIYKKYARSMITGKQARTKDTDYVRNIEFVSENASDGTPLYVGWLAITDFSGMIRDETIQGIRFRKGNILVGDNRTFARFFSEGQNANRAFAGEIHVLHPELIPNSQRDDFEPSPIYDEMTHKLTVWAGMLNKKYRRGTSEATVALKKLDKLNARQQELDEQVRSGAISSDERREQIAEELRSIEEKRKSETKKVRKALDQGTFDAERKETVERTLAQTEKAEKDATSLNKNIINADFATKNDLPSSYSRSERKLYQRIITVIDNFFTGDPSTAKQLRDAIKIELNRKKK